MKHVLLLSSILLLMYSFTGCSDKTLPQSAEVKLVSSKDEVITLQSTGYAKTPEQGLLTAEKNAFEILLFRGIPGSKQSTPLVGIDEKAKGDSKGYFEEFYEGQRYRTFLTSSGVQSIPTIKNIKGGKSVTVVLAINLRALRTDLEYNSIIRKFGY